jgi:hypothetical protein
MQNNALRERLKEPLDGARDVRVIALGVSRACALSATTSSALPGVLCNMCARTWLGDGKERRSATRLGVWWLRRTQDGARNSTSGATRAGSEDALSNGRARWP